MSSFLTLTGKLWQWWVRVGAMVENAVRNEIRGSMPANSHNRDGFPMAGHGPQMRFDVRGRLRNTRVPLNHAFLPIFEAVVNSIHSTQDRFGLKIGQHGRIDVHIHRAAQESFPIAGGQRVLEPIVRVEIADNGVGFNDSNIDSFETADTTAKLKRGGKGIGRFTWLVVFRSAVITSTFEKGKGVVGRRSFSFQPTEAGVEGYSEETSDKRTAVETRVTLEGVHDRYREPLRRRPDVIAEKLFEHCFNYIVLGQCPRITLRDDAADETIDVNAKLNEVERDEPARIQVGDHELTVLHVTRPAAGERKHEAHLCANFRVVESFPLSQLGELGPLLGADGEPRIHQVFVSGEALDAAANTTRTHLELPDGAPLLEYAGALDLRSLRQAVVDFLENKLADTLKSLRKENFDRVTTYIRSEQPEYRHLLRHRPDEVERVKWSDDPRQLDEELYRIQQGWDAEVRNHQAVVEQKLTCDGAELEKITEELYRVIMEQNEVGRSNLIRYVTKRRAVLQFLRKITSRFQGRALEEQVHNVIFPMKKSGDDVAYGDHNLWLVDDTLSFYEYLTSDLPFTQNEASPVKSRSRPDLLAFKTGDPYQHIAMIEFKRPDEDDDHPTQQLTRYAKLLRKGGRVDVDGHTMPPVDQSIRIDGYAIVTLTPTMIEKIETGPGNIRRVEGQQRWYGTVDNLNLTIEVLDFSAFLRRAEQRNRAFFTKLGLQ